MLLNWAGLATCAPSRLPALACGAPLQALPLVLALTLLEIEGKSVVHLAQRNHASATLCRKEYSLDYFKLLTLTALELELLEACKMSNEFAVPLLLFYHPGLIPHTVVR